MGVPELGSGVLEGFHQFFNDLGSVAALMGGGDMGFQVTAQYDFASPREGALHGLDLAQHVHAVHMRVVEHADDALDMPAGDGEAARRPFAGIFGHAEVGVNCRLSLRNG